jgi:thioredoxin-related protein
MNKVIVFLLIYLPTITTAQQSQTSAGIKWAEGLSWQQVKEIAKKENKYIFLDCFATWCLPCKKMDKNIYTNDSVGIFFNEKFISIKVQMDKTDSDNAYVKSWYDDASALNKEYRITEYPSFIFLSPQGAILHKDIGYKDVIEILNLAKFAIAPDKVYDNPYKEYDSLINLYKQGVKNYVRMPSMIRTALKVNDNSLAIEMVKDHTNYLMTLPKKERFTKENIEMWSSFSLSSNTRIFKFFYKDGQRIDETMNRKGYASKIVDGTIMNEIVTPFFKQQNKNPAVSMSGMYLTGGNEPPDYSEADWKKLKKLIRRKFNAYYTERNLLAAREEWYKRHRNYAAAAKYSLIQLNKYYPIQNETFNKINNSAFDAFMYSTDKKVIDGFIRLMNKLVHNIPPNAANEIAAEFLDTYANLLYKAGKLAEAKEWQEKAVKLSPDSDLILEAFEKMKKGERTYDAVWGYQ